MKLSLFLTLLLSETIAIRLEASNQIKMCNQIKETILNMSGGKDFDKEEFKAAIEEAQGMAAGDCDKDSECVELVED